MLKESFLKNDFLPLLRQLSSTDRGSWGVMNAQQMVEHFVDAVMLASGKLKVPFINDGERLEKSRNFMLSENPFRENTKNPMMSEQGAPLRKPTMDAAIEKLQIEFDHFFKVFEKPGLITPNPFFGELDREQNIHLLYKHALHHLKQFGIAPNQ